MFLWFKENQLSNQVLINYKECFESLKNIYDLFFTLNQAMNYFYLNRIDCFEDKKEVSLFFFIFKSLRLISLDASRSIG